MVFFGEYEVALTTGGRIALPKKIRDLLVSGELILTRGFGTCLAGYDRSDWEKRSQELMSVSLLDREHLEKRRSLFSSAQHLVIDDQGRIVLPRQHKQAIALGDKAVIIGVGDHFEIWNEETWKAYQANTNEI